MQMSATTDGKRRTNIPKRKRKHYSYNESADESPKLIENEPVEVEREIPTEESRPIESASLSGQQSARPPSHA
jgi:hypothetical protein